MLQVFQAKEGHGGGTNVEERRQPLEKPHRSGFAFGGPTSTIAFCASYRTVYRSSLISFGPSKTFRVYWTVNPDSPADCVVVVVPGGSDEFDTVMVFGATAAYGLPVVVSTRRPSVRE